MTVTEESRHQLHQALDDAIGPDPATTLMEHLPPVGWADVATKADLAHMQEVLDARFEVVDLRFDRERGFVEHRFDMLDLRFDREHEGVEHRFDMVDLRFDRIDERFAESRHRHDEVVRRLEGIESRFDLVAARLTYQFWQFLGLLVAFGAILIGVLRWG